jgi:hypothetical protein
MTVILICDIIYNIIYMESVPSLKAVSQMKTSEKYYRQGPRMRVNVYLYTDCHKTWFGKTGFNHAYLTLDELKRNLILVIPGLDNKRILLNVKSLKTMRPESRLEGKIEKNYLRIDNVIIPGNDDSCSIFLRECNEMDRVFNGIPCKPTLTIREIGLFITNALLFIQERKKKKIEEAKRDEEEAEKMTQSAMAKAIGLPPAPTEPLTGGKKSRKHNKKYNNKTKKLNNKYNSNKKNKKSRKMNKKSHKKTISYKKK